MTGATIKVLYNDCYGGFAFSPAFLAEFQARTNRTLDTYKALFRLGPNSIRCDPVAISIFEERGSEWCSGQHAALELREFPAIFANYWEIDDYDGNETVRVNVDGALADCLNTYMETRDIAALERQYKAIQEAKQAMCRVPIAPAEPVDTTPPVLPCPEHLVGCAGAQQLTCSEKQASCCAGAQQLKQSADVGPNEYGAYFSAGCS